MRQKLTSESSQVTAISSKAINGAGGIGKTRTAIEYAWQYADNYEALLFLSAETPSALEASLANLVGVLQLEGMEGAPDDVRLAAVYQWLQKHKGWLAILDSVDTPEAAEAVKQWLTQLAHGHVLITSRIATWAAGVETLDLGLLSIEASVAYLGQAADQRTVTDDDQAAAEEVANKVGQLALGLEHAAAYINVRGWSFAEYVEQWDKDEEAILSEFDLSLIEYPRELLVTWKLSIDRLDDDAKALLELLCWFAPEPIPLSILDTLPDETLLGSAETAINSLVRYSLINRQTIEGQRSIQIHRLAQAKIRYRLRHSPGEREPTVNIPSLTIAIQWINASLPEGDPSDVRTWSKWEPLRLHVDFIAKEGYRTHIYDPTSYLMSQLGIFLWSKALYSEAEPLMLTALEIDEKAFGSEHPSVANDLNNLASLLKTTNRIAEAEPLVRRALQIDENAYGPKHPRIAIHLSNLAQLLQTTNRMAEAEPLMRRALQIDENAYGPEHPKVATHLNNLAQLLQATNRITEAEPLMWRALQIDENAYGPEHPDVAIRLNNLASLLQATNRMREAEPLMRRALQIDENAYGPEHPKMATYLNNLAQLLKAANRLAEAEPLMRRALQIDENAYGPEHPSVATDLNNLASLLQATNRLAEAEPLIRRALEIDEKAYGPEHPSVAVKLNNLAQLLYATNRLKEAEPLLQRAVKNLTKSSGKHSSYSAKAIKNYLSLLQAMGFSESEIEVRGECDG